MRSFIRRRWFLIALAVVLGAGIRFPEPLAGPTEALPRGFIVAAVLFMIALPLDARAMWQALSKPRPALLATLVNMGLVPPLAWLAAPLLPAELGTGLIIIATIPCTLASAAVWTRRAGGNDAVAIMVTMSTNLICFAVTPAWLRLLTNTDVALDFGDMAGRLAMLVVLPILAAQVLRLVQPVAAWSSRNVTLLGVLSQFGVLTMILVGTVGSGMELAARPEARLDRPLEWLVVVAVVLGVHLAALVLGHLLCVPLKINRPERIAVGFAGSQKTLVIGLDIGIQFFGGLTILSMVIYHVGQLLVDTFIADKLAARGKAPPRAAPPVLPDSPEREPEQLQG